MSFTNRTFVHEIDFAFEETSRFGAIKEFRVFVNSYAVGTVEIFIDNTEELDIQVFRVAVWIGQDIEDFEISLTEQTELEMKKFAVETVMNWLRNSVPDEISFMLLATRDSHEEMFSK